MRQGEVVHLAPCRSFHLHRGVLTVGAGKNGEVFLRSAPPGNLCSHPRRLARSFPAICILFCGKQPVTYRVWCLKLDLNLLEVDPKLSKSRIHVRCCNIMNQKQHGSFALRRLWLCGKVSNHRTSESLSIRTV